MDKIAVIGDGYVGKAMSRLFQDHFATQTFGEGWDPGEVNEYDLKIICVPTPRSNDNSCDTSVICDVAEKLAGTVLIKSTVPPGFTQDLNERSQASFCFSPEYVGESSYFVPSEYMDPTDAKKHPFVIIGGPPATRSRIVQYFKKVMGPTPRYVQTTSTLAELTKYMENSFFATKVTFVNEWYDIAQSFGESFDELRELWLLDPRINRMHTAVFEDRRGFDGKCLSKDVAAIHEAARRKGYTPGLLAAVLKVNREMTEKSDPADKHRRSGEPALDGPFQG